MFNKLMTIEEILIKLHEQENKPTYEEVVLLRGIEKLIDEILNKKEEENNV